MYAIEVKNEGLIDMLIKWGADIHAKSAAVTSLSRVWLSSAMHTTTDGIVGGAIRAWILDRYSV